MDKEGIVTAIKKLILPELEAIKGNQAKMDVRLDAIEKRISDMNGHIVDQSRRIDELRAELTAKIDETNKRIDELRTDLTARIDETNKRIDELRNELTARIDDVRTDLTARIDETNKRVDQLTFQVGKVAQEMERIKREQVVTVDIITRLRSLETKTAHL